MSKHKQRHVLGGMYVEPAKLLTLVHDGLEAAEMHGREDIRHMSESVLSGVALVMRNRVGYFYEELGDRVEALEAELEKLGKKKLKRA